MPIKCFTKKTKKGKSYTTCSSPGKKKKKRVRRKTKKKSKTDEMVSAYENQARGVEPDIYSIIDQSLRDLDSQASSVPVERPTQLGRQPSNSYWDDPIENDVPAYIQSVQGDMRDRALLEEAEGTIPTNAPGGQIQLTGGTGRHMYYGADRMVLWGKKAIGQTETLTASVRNAPPTNIMPNSQVEEWKKNPKMKRKGRPKGSKSKYRGSGELIGAGLSYAYQRDNLAKMGR